jgi:hypothetical protein
MTLHFTVVRYARQRGVGMPWQCGTVARVQVDGRSVVVRLNLLETAMAFRSGVRVPLDAIESVHVQDRPLTRSPIMKEVRMGFAASGAPGVTLATVGPRAVYRDGRALLIVWRNGRSVILCLAPNDTGWRLLIVSQRDADEVAETVRAAALK